jgi:hypothetical protein
MRTLAAVIFAAALVPASAADKLPVPASAEVCGQCHRAIEEAWKSSVHADAMESRLFQDALASAESEFGGEARKVCLRCHAPLAGLTDDLALVRKTSWEGVTCDYCHSIRSVALGEGNPVVTVELGNVKSGPSKDLESPAHATAYSEVHTTALVCAPCHEFRNALGFPVVTTYTEWKDGPSGKAGVACQDCHMYLVEGNVVDPRVKRDAAHKVNLHTMPGSHSVSQLNKALAAKLTAKRSGDTVRVEVSIENKGVGHYMPTGSPMRQLILQVRATPAGQDTLEQERTFTRVLADGSGNAISHEYVAFLKAAKVLSDTRLAPGASRVESFTFLVPRSKRVKVEAAVYYFHPATADPSENKRIKFLDLVQHLP